MVYLIKKIRSADMEKDYGSIIKDVTRISDGITYRYVLTASKSLKVASFNIPLYSISVFMTKDGACTENSLNEIFADIGKATIFFDTLVENLATPIDLPYILEDKITL